MALTETAAMVMVLHGEIDLSNADGIAGATTLARHSGYTSVLFDFSDVTFMDSQGVKALFRACKDLGEVDGEVILRQPCDAVRFVVEATGLSTLVRIAP